MTPTTAVQHTSNEAVTALDYTSGKPEELSDPIAKGFAQGFEWIKED